MRLTGDRLKAVIKDVTRFASVGSFVGSEQVTLAATGGKLTCTTQGIVLTRTRTEVEEDLAPVSVDRRVLEAFAGVCSASAKVEAVIDGAEFVLRTKTREVRVPTQAAQNHKIPSTREAVGLTITREMARQLRYLGALAYKDLSRIELCCVLLVGADKRAVAMSQHTVGVFTVAVDVADKVPVPLTLAQAVEEGDVLYPGARDTVLKRGSTLYAVPALAKAAVDFPYGRVQQYVGMLKNTVAMVDGVKLASAIQECQSVVAVLAKTEVAVVMAVGDKRLVVGAENGGARYTSTVPVSVFHTEHTFRAPLDGLLASIPFLDGSVGLAVGDRGDLFLTTEKGWVMLAAWEPKKPVKRKKSTT